MKLKNIHSEFMNNFEEDSISANHKDNLPVLYKYGLRSHALLLRYKSAQGYRRLKELYSLSSISLFAKLHHGGPSSLKVVKKLLDACEISSDIISMADEMYHQQQNKWYPQRSLLAHLKETLDFSNSEFTCA